VPVPFGPIEPAPAIGITMRSGWLPTAIHQAFMDLVRKHVTDTAVLPMFREAS